MDDYKILYKAESGYRGKFGNLAIAIVMTVELNPKFCIAFLETWEKTVMLTVWSPVGSHDLVRFYRTVRILSKMENEIEGDQRLIFAVFNITGERANSKSEACLEYLRGISENIDYYREEVLKEKIPAKLFDKMLRVVGNYAGGRVSYLERYTESGIITKTKEVEKAIEKYRFKKGMLDEEIRRARKRIPIEGRIKKLLRKYGVRIGKTCYAVSGSYIYLPEYEMLVCDYKSPYHYFSILCIEGPKNDYIGHPIVVDKELGTIVLVGYSFQFPSKKGDSYVSYVDYADETNWIEIKEIKHFRPDCCIGVDHKIEHRVE